MSLITFNRYTAVPGSWTANSINFIADSEDANISEIYIVGATTTDVRRMINEADVQALIDATVAGISQMQLVADIAARDALTLNSNSYVLVSDASADSSVNSGAAAYFYDNSGDTFTKVYEFESLDVQVTWSSISGKPSSTPIDIDDAVTKRHTHSNKTQIDKVGEDVSGNFQYDGEYPKIEWESEDW